MSFPKTDKHGRKRSPYAVNCDGPMDVPGYGCGLVYLTDKEYNQQTDRPDSIWRCPICRCEAFWNGDNLEDFYE